MKSPENGTAELKARHPLNCERKESYVLTIAAVACNGQVSERYDGGNYKKGKNEDRWHTNKVFSIHQIVKYMLQCQTKQSC